MTNNLTSQWSVYCDDGSFQGFKATSYEKQIMKLGEFSTVEDFWRLCTSVTETIKRLSPEKFNVRVFKAGIKPMWEDPKNRNGGKWVWSCATELSVFLSTWKEAMSSVLGSAAGDASGLADSLCGVVLVGRRMRREVQIWVSNQPSEEERSKMKDMHQALCSQFKVGKLTFKSHQDTEKFMKVRASAVKTKRSDVKVTLSQSSPDATEKTDAADTHVHTDSTGKTDTAVHKMSELVEGGAAEDEEAEIEEEEVVVKPNQEFNPTIAA
eukprot:gb/GEZN01009984.1/.p1 GENE.gb/GEZN01009984.1/~~gb/GEZN01009984.1/.p1  ORF type:complete len:267 (+),score=61.52 gb/GEZN01009984.1/:51-851(+)